MNKIAHSIHNTNVIKLKTFLKEALFYLVIYAFMDSRLK